VEIRRQNALEIASVVADQEDCLRTLSPGNETKKESQQSKGKKRTAKREIKYRRETQSNNTELRVNA
jgi:hypothetical protein